MFGRKKIYNCKKLIHVFKIAWVKESTLCVNSFLKNYFCKKVCSFCEKRTSKIWDVLFLLSYLPPLSDFVLFCLTPPTPPKIGHHLCTFPYSKQNLIKVWSSLNLQNKKSPDLEKFESNQYQFSLRKSKFLQLREY